jgi:hypothetical protein
VRSQNPKDFEHWFSQRLWVKFTMFLLNSTSVDAGAIMGWTLAPSMGDILKAPFIFFLNYLK